MTVDLQLGPHYPLFNSTASFEACQAQLQALELGDGLPLVPPTGARLDRMLEGVQEPATVWGRLPPLMGALRPDTVAYQCVLAGCAPTCLPLIMTALQACLEPDFNLLGISTTTGTPAVAMVVHGPLAQTLGLSSSSNCLGPGAHANGALGRALSLTLRNVGGAKEGVGDMATMGQPGKFTFCLAEAAHSPWPSLAERRGLGQTPDAVTVMGVSGTAEVLPINEADTAEAILAPIAAAMGSAISVSGARSRHERGEQLFLLPPELAAQLAKYGWSLAAIQNYLFDTARVQPLATDTAHGNPQVAHCATAIQPIVTGGPGVKMTYVPLWSGGTATVTRAVPQSI